MNPSYIFQLLSTSMQEQLARQDIGTDAMRSGVHRRPGGIENPFTPAHAARRILVATMDMPAGKRIEGPNLGQYPQQLMTQRQGATSFFRGVIHIALAYQDSRFPADRHALDAREHDIAEAATEAGLLSIFGAETFPNQPARMTDFLQLYTGSRVTQNQAAPFPDMLLVSALQDGTGAMVKVWREEMRQAVWETFYAIEKRKGNTLFYSSDPATGCTIERNTKQMALALYGANADFSPEIWLVEPPEDTMR